VAFVGKRPRILLDDVRTVASSSKAFTVFELARYLSVKDLHNTLKSLDMLFRNGEDTPMMIGALSRHFRQLWRVREMLDRKAARPDIGREVGINPYFLDDTIKQAKNFRRGELRSIFAELYRCDLASKTGGGQPYTLMHGLVSGICNS
jgi:DNA polymerase-3 subunit delta